MHGVDDNFKAFKSLLDEISAALVDVVDSLKLGHESSSEAATALSEIVGLLEGRKSDAGMADLVAAVKAMRIKASDVTVNVSPTPLTITPVVHLMAAEAKGATWKVSIPGHDGEPAKVMTITRTA